MEHENIRQGWKWLRVANTLAFYNRKLIIAVKIFYSINLLKCIIVFPHNKLTLDSVFNYSKHFTLIIWKDLAYKINWVYVFEKFERSTSGAKHTKLFLRINAILK